MRPSWRTCTGGVTSLLLQIMAPGQAGLSYGAEALSAALKGVFLDACAMALDARENTMDAAGSLIEIWRAANLERERSGAAPSTTIRSACWPHRHALLPGGSLLRNRRQVRQRLPDHDARHGAAGRRPALPRGRRQRGAGAGRHAGDAGRLSARLRGTRACARAWRSARSGWAWRPMPTCS